MNKKTVTLTLSPEAIQQGKEQAKTEKRNFSNYVEWLISEDKKRLDLLNSNPY